MHLFAPSIDINTLKSIQICRIGLGNPIGNVILGLLILEKRELKVDVIEMRKIIHDVVND